PDAGVTLITYTYEPDAGVTLITYTYEPDAGVTLMTYTYEPDAGVTLITYTYEPDAGVTLMTYTYEPDAGVTLITYTYEPDAGVTLITYTYEPDAGVTLITYTYEPDAGVTLITYTYEPGAGVTPIRLHLTHSCAPFATSESLIDAVLDEQLNEEAWSVSSSSQRLARDTLAETLHELVPSHYRRSPSQGRSSGQSSASAQNTPDPSNGGHRTERDTQDSEKHIVERKMSLEEENRQLKESRMCKVCMDSEVKHSKLHCFFHQRN
ncbi:putative inhibitor of apoptosis 2 protein, partial [Operophtera brumata]